MAQDLLVACVRARCARTSTMWYGESGGAGSGGARSLSAHKVAHNRAHIAPSAESCYNPIVVIGGHPPAMQRVLHG